MITLAMKEPAMPDQGAPFDLAAYGESPGLPHLCTRIAGLQYYDYDKVDEMIGRIRPERGDRLELLRQPDNRHDANAVEVRWRNGRLHLGHLPRQVALRIAPLLDAGRGVRCYAMNSGDGSGWSVWTVLVSAHLPAQIAGQPQL